MRRLGIGIAVLMLVMGTAGSARADIIFSLDQGTIQPDEHLKFNQAGLIDEGFLVQGITSDSNTIIDFTGHESLSTTNTTVESTDGNGFDYALVNAHDGGVAFEEFEANLNIFARASGFATVTACNPASTGGGCETFNFALDSGENFFVLSVADNQLLRSIEISTTTGLLDIGEIRIDGFHNGTDVTPVPEPASMTLLGLGLAGAAARLRRRSDA
jgi:hypothetical protein